MKKLIPVILFLIIGILIGLQLAKLPTEKQEKTIKFTTEKEIEIPIVAIDNNGKGKLANLITQLKPGTGLILVNINNVLADYDTQNSARTAANLASTYTNISLENKDIIYQIKTDAEIIAGPSAGSSMAIATIALLQDKQLKDNVIITGSILKDGTIAEAGAIEQKAEAAKQANANLFLIPKGSYLYEYKQEKKCYNNDEYCEIKTISVLKSTIQKLGIELREVSNIKEALSYYEIQEEI